MRSYTEVVSSIYPPVVRTQLAAVQTAERIHAQSSEMTAAQAQYRHRMQMNALLAAGAVAGAAEMTSRLNEAEIRQLCFDLARVAGELADGIHGLLREGVTSAWTLLPLLIGL